jgi:Ran GTPase-activating protein (RanGAP) involved in mRNA processing and transport
VIINHVLHVDSLPLYYVKNLRDIGLGDNQITDAGLMSLAKHARKFSNLHQIYLKDNKIKKAGMKAMRAEYSQKFSLYT